MNMKRSLIAGLLPLAWLASGPAAAGDATLVGDDTVLASYSAPQDGLSCADAAAQTQLSFKTLRVPFAVKRVSVFVNGQGIDADAIQETWPTVTLTGGLVPGRNSVEFVLYGDNGESVVRQQTVLIGTPPTTGDDAPWPISCADGDYAAGAATDESPAAPTDDAVVVDDPPPYYYGAPPTVYVDRWYDPGYYPAPIFIYESRPPPVYYYPPDRGHRPPAGGWHGGWHGNPPPASGGSHGWAGGLTSTAPGARWKRPLDNGGAVTTPQAGFSPPEARPRAPMPRPPPVVRQNPPPREAAPPPAREGGGWKHAEGGRDRR